LGNGQGKGRSQKSGGLRATQTFRVLFLSTGEKTIEDHLSDGGQQLRGGHDVRLIQIPAEYSKGMGVFEKLHEHKTAMEFATTLGNAARRYYGTPIRRFLELLANDRDQLLGDLRQLSADFFTANLPKHAHSETQRKLKHFAHVAAAGEIATRLGITGWRNGEAAEAVRRCWLDMLAQRGGEGPQDVERGISQLRRFILTQGETRFLRLDWKDEREEIDGNTETVYFIIPEVMKEDILKGSDVSNVARELRRRGTLMPDKAPSRSLQYRKRLPLPGSKDTKQMRVYAVLASILEAPSSAEEQ
jgi:putative DNA primase/helicase